MITRWICGLDIIDQPYFPFACDFVRSARKYHVWLPDGSGDLVATPCVEVFVPPDSPAYMGPLNCGSPQYEAQPVPKYPGLWSGDKPVWVRGGLFDALVACGVPDTGAYSEAYGFAWDSLHL